MSERGVRSLDTVREVYTPEGVALRLPAAGPVPRALAWLIDSTVRFSLLFLVGMIAALLNRVGMGVYLIAYFVIFWGYPILFEVLWDGQTLGKRAMSLRVISDDGAPVGWLASIVRNLLRTVDFLPFGYATGLVAGFFPRLLGPSIMRLMDIMLALPSLLLAVAIVAILGPGLINTVIAIAIVSLPSYVRLTRASVMGELNRDYVTASRLAGAGLLRLMFVTVLPNCMAPLIVQATLSFSSAILDAAALGFLGLGVQPPTPEWGTMLASARDYIERAWWVVSLPGLTILLSVLAINLMGDGLRDALDPKLKNAV